MAAMTDFNDYLADRIEVLERRIAQKRKRISFLTESRDYWKKLAVAAGASTRERRLVGPAHPTNAAYQRRVKAAADA